MNVFILYVLERSIGLKILIIKKCGIVHIPHDESFGIIIEDVD